MHVPQVGAAATGAAGASAAFGSELAPAAAVVRDTAFCLTPLGKPSEDISLSGVMYKFPALGEVGIYTPLR